MMDFIRLSLKKSSTAREIVKNDDEEEIEIKPVFRKINQAGVVYIDFEPRDV